MSYLRFSAFFALVSFAPLGLLAAETKAESPKKVYTLDNCSTVFDRAKAEPTKVGYQFWFADKNLADGQTLKMSVVAPHQATHPPHKHAEDEFFFVLEGTAEVYLNGETRVIPAYGSFYCPSGSEHGIRNVGDKELKYLVVKKYLKP